MKTKSPKQKELDSYKDAVWDYMLEHCDITENGSFFIKFHTSTRRAFEGHVNSRWKNNYHRRDERLNLSHIQKDKDAQSKREAHQSRKAFKKRSYKLTKEESKRVQKALARQKELQQMNPINRFIHRSLCDLLHKKWYNKVKRYVNIAIKNKES